MPRIGLGIGLHYRGSPLDPSVAAYAAANNIGAAEASKINIFLSALTAAAGERPVFLHIGGSLYNNATNTALVIGTGGTLVGGEASNPTSGTNFMRTTRSSKYLRADNPTAGQSNWTWAQWAKTRDRANDHNLIALRDDLITTQKGPLIYDQTGGIKTSTSSNGSTNNVNIFPLGNAPSIIDGGIYNALSRTSGSNLRSLFSAGHIFSGYTNVYNSHAYVRIGGVNDTATSDWLASNAEFYATVAFNKSLNEAQQVALRSTIFDSGIATRYTDIPLLITLGDSTTANKWNGSMHIGNQGGAWRYNHAAGYPHGVNDGTLGGSTFHYHYGVKQNIIDTLNASAWEDRYFAYTVDTPDGMPLESEWDALGIPFGDEDAFYDKVEEWLLEIEAATGATIVACSYIKGNLSSTTYREAQRDKVQSMASNNGWLFVDFWADPHSKVYTGAVPGTYGFYTDQIHQTAAGQIIQSEIFTSVVPHPVKTAAPRFDVANPPTISGTEQVGQTLSCTTGTLHVAGTSYTYQWLRNLTAISGATSSSYTLQAADSGTRIACRVTAIKSGQNSASFTSAPTGEIAP